MLNFRKWLNEADYIDPDVAYGINDELDEKSDKIIPFIYTNQKKIFYPLKSNDDTHYDIIVNIPELKEIYYKYNKDMGFSGSRSYLENNFWLFGRIGHYTYDREHYNHSNELVVSFWGHNPLLFNNLLKPCLDQLAKDNKINIKRDFVSTVNHGTIPISELFDAKTANPEYLKKQQMAQAIHLMSPQEKMAQLKAAGWTPKKNSWQSAADSSKITVPGHKFWAINSEAIKN